MILGVRKRKIKVIDSESEDGSDATHLRSIGMDTL